MEKLVGMHEWVMTQRAAVRKYPILTGKSKDIARRGKSNCVNPSACRTSVLATNGIERKLGSPDTRSRPVKAKRIDNQINVLGDQKSRRTSHQPL
jgi:hypothetical protein